MEYTEVKYIPDGRVKCQHSSEYNTEYHRYLDMDIDRVISLFKGWYDSCDLVISGIVDGARVDFFHRKDKENSVKMTADLRKKWRKATNIHIIFGKRSEAKHLKRVFRANPVETMDTFVKSKRPRHDPPMKAQYKTGATGLLARMENMDDKQVAEVLAKSIKTEHGSVFDLAGQYEEMQKFVEEKKKEFEKAEQEAFAVAARYAEALKEVVKTVENE